MARATFFGGSLVLLVVLLAFSARLLPAVPARFPRGPTRAIVIALTVVALGKFYAHELVLGQTNVLLALLILLAVGAWWQGRNVGAGLLFAAATVAKPYAILFLPYLALRQRWRIIVAFGAGLAAALVLPALRYGVSGNASLLVDWWTTVTASTAHTLASADNISLAGMYAKWFGPGALAATLALGSAAVLLTAVATMLFRPTESEHPEYLEAAVLLTLIPLLSPQGWDYVLVVSTPAVMLLVSRFGVFGRVARVLAIASLAIAGLVVYDLVGRDLYRSFMAASMVSVCALVEVGLLVRLRNVRAA